jgi:hypothetical protein
MSGAEQNKNNPGEGIRWYSAPEAVEPLIARAESEGATLPPTSGVGEQMTMIGEFRRFAAASKYVTGLEVETPQS